MENLKVEEFEQLKNQGYLFQLATRRELYRRVHTHEFYEITGVISGHVVHYIDGEKIIMKSGDIVFLSPENAHCFLGQSKDSQSFALSVVKEKFEEIQRASEVVAEYGKIFRYSKNTFKLISETLFVKDEMKKIKYNELLFNFFVDYCVDNCDKNLRLPTDIKNTIDKIVSEKKLYYNVNGIAELSGYSTSQLNRIIKKNYGCTTIELLTKIKLETAENLLLSTNMKIKDIGKECGFRSQSAFIHLFEKKYGQSPKVYRNLYKKQY